jgi:signal transduction histidine kinase
VSVKEPDASGDFAQARFATRARALYYARLAFLTLGLGVLAVPGWRELFGLRSGSALLAATGVYFTMLVYSVANAMVMDRPRAGRIVTFVTLCLDLLVIVYLIAATGGLGSPLLAAQLMFTTLFVILFPQPLALLPPLLCLPVVARVDQVLGTGAPASDLFTVLWYSAINLILIYAIVYLNQREEAQQRELNTLQQELRQMAVVEERNRLAREIHDGLGAALSSLIIQSEYLAGLAGGDPQALRRELAELKGAAEESIDELRRSLQMMREDFRLVPAVEDHCRTFGDRSKLAVDFRCQGQERPLSSEAALAIFRVLQEALTNAARHGQASCVQVLLAFEADRLALSVRDDGKGFDPGAPRPGHYGLDNMQERARKVAGQVVVDAAPGRGTAIALHIPYPP